MNKAAATSPSFSEAVTVTDFQVSLKILIRKAQIYFHTFLLPLVLNVYPVVVPSVHKKCQITLKLELLSQSSGVRFHRVKLNL